MNKITSPRRFVIDSMGRLLGVVGFIQTLDLSKPVEIIIQRPKRTNPQNAHYWAMVSAFARWAGDSTGQYRTAEQWHYVLKCHLLGMEEVGGVMVAVHSKDKDIPDFAEYVARVEGYLLSQFGFQFH